MRKLFISVLISAFVLALSIVPALADTIGPTP